VRIVGGAWRGRRLVAPAGTATRPSADRVRQALFDLLLHAPWGGRGVIEGAQVLDAFAGTGGFGLEALSRGAAHASFMDINAGALAALRANVAALGAADRAAVIAADVLHCPEGAACGLVFLDPPYGCDLVRHAVPALARAGWIGPGSLLVAELGRADALPDCFGPLLASRVHGAARLAIWRTELTQIVT
jgi:16S rRNA (guanine966-N2)-methyltransferase